MTSGLGPNGISGTGVYQDGSGVYFTNADDCLDAAEVLVRALVDRVITKRDADVAAWESEVRANPPQRVTEF